MQNALMSSYKQWAVSTCSIPSGKMSLHFALSRNVHYWNSLPLVCIQLKSYYSTTSCPQWKSHRVMQWKTENRCTVWGKAYSPRQPWQGMMVNSVEYTLLPFFYIPCLPLPSIWLNLASVLANALGWTGPCQTWIHQSLSASRGGERGGGKAEMEWWAEERRRGGGRLGWSIATSPPSLTLFFLSPNLPVSNSKFGVSCQVTRGTLNWF